MTHDPPVRAHVAPQRASFWEKLGPGGLATLLLALGTGLLGLGIPVAIRMRRVAREALGDPLRGADAILVLGRRLVDDRPTEVFRARLAHAADLWRQGWAGRIIVAGGVTGCATRSEAEAGRDLLLQLGLPGEALEVEGHSQHTLENLYNVRRTLRAREWRCLILVSDPLHLARAAATARNLDLDVVCSPALEAPPLKGSLSWWNRLFQEGFLLHWYLLGVAYSRLIRSRRQLVRVT